MALFLRPVSDCPLRNLISVDHSAQFVFAQDIERKDEAEGVNEIACIQSSTAVLGRSLCCRSDVRISLLALAICNHKVIDLLSNSTSFSSPATLICSV